MSDAALDTLVFATDRKAQVEVRIGGELLGSGIDTDGNLVSVDVSFDIDTMPPTASLGMRAIPSWVKRRQRVEIDAGYNGQLTRIFTGKVKRRRPGVSVSTIDCVGRTNALTQPMRARAGPRSPAKKFAAATTAEAAILDILEDDGVDFTEAFGETVNIDIPAWSFNLDAYLDLNSAGDMIRLIADADQGCRAFESRAGTLHVRALLEAPAPSPFRTYGTVGAGSSVETPLTFDPNGTAIDTNDALGDAAARARRSQGWKPTVAGAAANVSLWLKKVGSPTDFIQFSLYNDDGAGLPGTVLLGSSSKYSGQFLDTTSYIQVQLLILSGTELVAGTQYHIVVRRVDSTGAASPPDAANYYLVGRASAGGYAGGAPGVYNSGTATWGALAGDYSFSTGVTTFSALRLLNIASDEDEDQVKKQMTVLGAVLSSTDAEGNVTQTQVYGESHIVSDDLVAGDYRYFSGSYQNALIQTNAKADAKAEQLRDKYYRVLDTIEIEVPFDPRLDLGTTLGIVDPQVTKLSGNWWIRAYHHVLNATSANTSVSLFGGDQSGTTGVTEPRPDFTWKVEQELIGNAIMQVITFSEVTASPSSKIVDYHWTDDYAGGAMDVHGPDLFKVTRAYDPALATVVHVTLTVTDDSNPPQVISITHNVDVTASNTAGVYAPMMSCAAGNTCMVTITGGRTWIDKATPSGLAKVTAITYDPTKPTDPLIFFFGTTTGRIYRTIDNNGTLVLVYTDVDGDPITCIIADIVRRGLLWATTTDRVLFSPDFGVTWYVYTDFNVLANWSSTNSFVTFGDDVGAITGTRALGDAAARQRWEQEFTPAAAEAGTLVSVSLWLQRVGAPNDNVQVNISADNAGDPGTLIAASPQIVGSTISSGGAQKVTFLLTAGIAGTKYHIVVDRTGGVDAANYYLISSKASGTSAKRWDGAAWVSDTDSLVLQLTTSHLVGVIGGPIDPRPINRIIGSDPSVNRIWIMGGVGNVVESWFHTNYIPDGGGPGAWHSETSEGDGVAAFPRNALDTVVDSVVSHQTSGDLGLMFKRNGAGVPDNPYIYSKLFHPVGQADWKFGAGAMVTPGADGVGVEGDNLQFQEFLALLDNKTAYVSNDGLGFWPIPNVFPGTGANRPHHLVNVSAWKDIYLAASDEGIAKTIDRGLTWAFFRPMGAPINTTWPAGAIGWEVAFDYRGPAANPSFKLLLAIHDPTAGKTATVIRNGIGPWTKQSEDATNWPTVDLYSFPALSRIFRTRNDHLNPDPRGATPSIWETLQYSDDVGVTWVNTTVLQCPDITRAANGDLYALSGAGDNHAHKVFRSVDNGDNWTLVKNDTTLFGGILVDYRRIVADPVDKDVVIALSYQQSFMRTINASTGGPWTITNPTFSTCFERTNFELLIGQNSRYFAFYENCAVQQVLIDYSDDGGVTWHNSLTQSSSGNEPPRAFFTGAKDIYAMHTALLGLMRSRDNGATWEHFTDVGQHALLRGYAWNAPDNILYCGTEYYPLSGDPDSDIEQMVNPLVTFGDAGTWVQVGAGIADATGYTKNELCSEGMEIVK